MGGRSTWCEVGMLVLVGCTTRATSSGAEGSTSGGDVATVTSGAVDSSGAGASETSAGSTSTGGVVDECPIGSEEVGAMRGLGLDDAWPMRAESGVDEATCTAVGHDAAASTMTLTCIVDGGGPDPLQVQLYGGGPVVAEMLDAMVGLADLRLASTYTSSFFPGISDRRDYTLRTARGELLVLWSRSGREPDAPAADVGIAGWTAPFASLTLVDEGCPFRPNDRGTTPDASKPFAVEADTDRGTATIFEGEQATVLRDGVSFEISVPTAHIPSDVCTKCPAAESELSIVRHL